MKFFLLSLWISIGRRLWSRSALILLASYALLLGGCGWLLETGETTSVRVGIVFQSENQLSSELMGHLESDGVMMFQSLDLPREQVEEMVATGELECAFFIPRSLKGSILSGDHEGAVEMVKSPRSLLDSLARLRLFVALTECISPEIAEKELASRSDLAPEELAAYVAERYAYYGQNYTFVETEARWQGEADRREALPPPLSAARILHGMLALFIVVSVAVSLPSLISEQAHLRGMLPAGRMACYWLCCILSVWLFALVTGALGLVLLRALYPALLSSAQAELAALLLYSGACAALGCLPALFLRSSDLIFSAGVFVLLCCLVLGGVLIDPAELGGVLLRVSRFFLTTHYIDSALSGRFGSLIPCAGALLLALPAGCLLPFWRFRRRGLRSKVRA